MLVRAPDWFLEAGIGEQGKVLVNDASPSTGAREGNENKLSLSH
jgi:hypothetical protein